MIGYIIRRLLLIIPTLLAIITLNFFIVQLAPGGPVDQAIAQMQGLDTNMAMERISGSESDQIRQQPDKNESRYMGARGLDPQVIAEIEKQYGFDRPLHERYLTMLGDYLSFNLGDSLFKNGSVVSLIIDRIPISISLGLWSTLIIYLVSIPLGIRKAVRHGSKFDIWTSTAVIVGNAIPGFLFGILLIVLFAGGSFLNLFPLKGLVSENWDSLPWWGQILDYFWHMALPIITMTIGGFAVLTFLTKNSFLDEIGKQYVITARSKGNTEKAILWKHVFRNGMILVIAGFPSAFIGLFFTGSVLVEVIFSLDGMGLLGFNAVMQRDYTIMFGTLYIFTLMGLILGLVSDITYTIVDPRIDFESRKA